MAQYLKLACDRCDFAQGGSDGELYVVCEDGSEVLCWHPGEDYTAREVTGCEWEQLAKEDRFRRRESYLCLNCGIYGFYGRHKGQAEGVVEPYIAHAPAAEVYRSIALQCAACGRKRLCRIAGRLRDFGCLPLMLPFVALANLSEGAVAWWGLGASLLFLLLIWDLPGLRPLRPACPRCKKGRLRRQITGMS